MCDQQSQKQLSHTSVFTAAVSSDAPPLLGGGTENSHELGEGKPEEVANVRAEEGVQTLFLGTLSEAEFGTLFQREKLCLGCPNFPYHILTYWSIGANQWMFLPSPP